MPVSDLLKPLAVFCSQLQSQPYVKKIQNLGDAWRTLPEPHFTETDIIIKTTSDFTLRIIIEQNGNISVEMATSGEHKTALAPDPVHQRCISFGYSRCFIWRNYNDIEYEK
ncbi:uncharacterized protein EURHEDRAFT_402578 [Aspergillus ruber CBS 135680]|uniref:Uncharacterized protein n=1 Tax=Aspergillus ruber (strain CBS 135680) TaxID=1388766 RepID=A0A017SED7_ASPRC|nr:uncharacterized protein EURHEDRAFT_402578 [Aspergillus ruber CBS 135680]EYE95388.1 hypothetical protein EURHEDRAFT_402578 [Aspergillus ruber CBS 135680]